LHKDPNKRPPIWDIIRVLNELDKDANNVSAFDEVNQMHLSLLGVNHHGNPSLSPLSQICPLLEDMLRIEPLELHFQFQLNTVIKRSVVLINDTDDYFAYRITTSSLVPYCTQPSKNIVPPRSKCGVTITLQALEMESEKCKYGASQFYVQSTRVDESLAGEDITEDLFSEKAGKVVDKVDLIVVLE
jgi:coatomer subunit beta'